MSARRYIPLLVTSGAIVLGGYGIMLFVTPTDDQVKAQMTPEQRKKFDAQAQERMDDKQRLFEHLKYNMNSDKPIWDVQWDKLRDDKPRSEYPPVRTVVPPPRKREGKGKAAED